MPPSIQYLIKTGKVDNYVAEIAAVIRIIIATNDKYIRVYQHTASTELRMKVKAKQ